MSIANNPYNSNNLSFGNHRINFLRIEAKSLAREVRAKRVVNLHAIAAGLSTGAVSQVPGLDYLVLTGVSSHMIHKLAKIYNIPWTKELNVKLIATLATENAASMISDSFQYFPIIGNIANGLLSVGITKVTGNFFKSTFKAISGSKGKIKSEEINISELKNNLGSFAGKLKNKLTFKKAS